MRNGFKCHSPPRVRLRVNSLLNETSREPVSSEAPRRPACPNEDPESAQFVTRTVKTPDRDIVEDIYFKVFQCTKMATDLLLHIK